MVDPSTDSLRASSSEKKSGKRSRTPPLVNGGKEVRDKKRRVPTTHSSSEASREDRGKRERQSHKDPKEYYENGSSDSDDEVVLASEDKTTTPVLPPHVDKANLLINPEDIPFLGYRHTEKTGFQAKLTPQIVIPGKPDDRKGQVPSVKLSGDIFSVKVGKSKKEYRQTPGCGSIGMKGKPHSCALLKKLESSVVPVANANEFCQNEGKTSEFSSNPFFTMDKKTKELSEDSFFLRHKGKGVKGGAPYDFQGIDFAACQDGKTTAIKYAKGRKMLEKGRTYADVYLAYAYVYPNMKEQVLYHRLVITRIVLHPDVEVETFNPLAAMLKTKRSYGDF